MRKIRVGITGYGTIGRRVADAVARQPDMELVGVAKVRTDYRARLIAERGYPLYGADEESVAALRAAGLPARGTVADLVAGCDVVVDTLPPKQASRLLPVYQASEARVIFQGGEPASIAEVSFNAQSNYEAAVGRRTVRVVSCNTTGLCRALGTIDRAFGVEKARVVLARKATDPDDPDTGPVDAVVLDPAPAQLPSHHGRSVATVLPHLKVISMAAKVPTTHAHFHSLLITVKDRNVTAGAVVRAFEEATRVVLLDSREGFRSTAQVFDYARELGRSRSDLYELAVWRDSVTVVDDEVYFFMAVHQEAIVIPENVDAIRAVTGAMDRDESIRLTNRTLGIVK